MLLYCSPVNFEEYISSENIDSNNNDVYDNYQGCYRSNNNPCQVALFGRYWLIIVKKGTGFIVQNCEHVWNLMRNTIYWSKLSFSIKNNDFIGIVDNYVSIIY